MSLTAAGPPPSHGTARLMPGPSESPESRRDAGGPPSSRGQRLRRSVSGARTVSDIPSPEFTGRITRLRVGRPRRAEPDSGFLPRNPPTGGEYFIFLEFYFSFMIPIVRSFNNFLKG
jgi:hypothetical protein